MKQFVREARALVADVPRPKKHFGMFMWRNMPLRVMLDTEQFYWVKMRALFPQLPIDVLEKVSILAIQKLAQEARDDE